MSCMRGLRRERARSGWGILLKSELFLSFVSGCDFGAEEERERERGACG